MPAADDEHGITVLAATGLEARAVRRAAPNVRVIESGVKLMRIGDRQFSEIVITCGLAGALKPDIPTESVIVPDHVLRPEGTLLECDHVLVEKLDAAARRVGCTPLRGALVTTNDLISGSARTAWGDRGYLAVDMETGFVRAPRVACVRVILDTPQREVSDAWLQPWSVIIRPGAWGQVLWLARAAPRCAQLAAAVVAEALKDAAPDL